MSDPFVILITGSRRWTDPAPIRADLARFQAVHGDRLTVIHGGAPGADSLADRAARALGIDVVPVPAQWTTHDREGTGPVPCRCSAGKRLCVVAGPRRNQRMLAEWAPSLVLAYRRPGRSPGTDDMVRRAETAGVEVLVRAPEGVAV